MIKIYVNCKFAFNARNWKHVKDFMISNSVVHLYAVKELQEFNVILRNDRMIRSSI
jgi:hypothetical protein